MNEIIYIYIYIFVFGMYTTFTHVFLRDTSTPTPINESKQIYP
jgi:hypothetical protein